LRAKKPRAGTERCCKKINIMTEEGGTTWVVRTKTIDPWGTPLKMGVARFQEVGCPGRAKEDGRVFPKKQNDGEEEE